MSQHLIAALLIDPPLDLYSGEARFYDVLDAPLLALCAVLMALGVASIGVRRLRNRSNERGLALFGVLSCVYALRMLFSSDQFRFMVTLDKPQRLKWGYPEWAVAYTLIPLAALLLSEVFPEWGRLLLRRLVRLSVVFSVVAIATDVILHRYGFFRLPFSAVIVVGLVAMVRAIPPRADHGPHGRLLRVASIALIAAVLVESAWLSHSNTYVDSARLLEIEAFCFMAWLLELGAFGSHIIERDLR
jgi:hypothetical protein